MLNNIDAGLQSIGEQLANIQAVLPELFFLAKIMLRTTLKPL
jgi:hypothetical protein